MSKALGKVIWITGASSGIGEAIARQFAKDGAHLILTARRADELERVARETGLTADRFMILPLDLTSFDQFPSAVEQVLFRFGKIDILINNAGISSRGLVAETDMEVYRKVMELDFFSTVALTKAVLPTMTAANNGQIVVVSSLMGKFSTPWRSAYCAAKHALHGFYDALRSEVYQHNIAISIICPGFVRTNVSFNALDVKGNSRNIQDETNKNGMDPDQFATKMLSAILAKKEEAYIGGYEVRGIWAKRFLPGLLSKKMRSFKPH